MEWLAEMLNLGRTSSRHSPRPHYTTKLYFSFFITTFWHFYFIGLQENKMHSTRASIVPEKTWFNWFSSYRQTGQFQLSCNYSALRLFCLNIFLLRPDFFSCATVSIPCGLIFVAIVSIREGYYIKKSLDVPPSEEIWHSGNTKLIK